MKKLSAVPYSSRKILCTLKLTNCARCCQQFASRRPKPKRKALKRMRKPSLSADVLPNCGANSRLLR